VAVEVLRYSTTEPGGPTRSTVLYRDAGVYRVRAERGSRPEERTAGRAVRESEVEQMLERLGGVRLGAAPHAAAVDYTDPTTYELRFWSGGCGFAVRWLEQLPSDWAPLREFLTWLEDRTPEK
jgi:hypothetical protein